MKSIECDKQEICDNSKTLRCLIKRKIAEICLGILNANKHKISDATYGRILDSIKEPLDNCEYFENKNISEDEKS